MADNPAFPVGTATVSWMDSNGQLHQRVYSTDGYTVVEMVNDGNGWQDAFSTQGSDVSATCWVDSQGNEHIRVYCTADDQTTEWCYDAPNGWSKGSYQQPTSSSTSTANQTSDAVIPA